MPILILHSDDDGFVPSDGIHELSPSRGPTSSSYEVFEVARHTKLWNYDQRRAGSDASVDWLDEPGLDASATETGEPSATTAAAASRRTWRLDRAPSIPVMPRIRSGRDRLGEADASAG